MHIRFITIMLVFLFMACRTEEIKTTYTYKVDEQILLSVLNLQKNSTDQQIEDSLNQFFKKAVPELNVDYGNKLISICVCGTAEKVKIFEYLFLNTFEDMNSFKVTLTLDDGMGEKIYEETVLKPSQCFNQFKFKSENNSDEGSDINLTLVSYDFEDKQELEAEIQNAKGNLVYSLNFKTILHNGEEEPFSFIITDKLKKLERKFHGKIKLSWTKMNSNFFDHFLNLHPLEKGDEIAVVRMSGKHVWEEFLKINFETNTREEISAKFKSYLSEFGMNFGKNDQVFPNHDYTKLIVISNSENCQRFRVVMQPLICLLESKLRVSGEIYMSDKHVASYSFPTTSLSHISIKSQFFKFVDREDDVVENVHNEENFNLSIETNFPLSTDSNEIIKNVILDYSLEDANSTIKLHHQKTHTFTHSKISDEADFNFIKWKLTLSGIAF